MTALRRTFLAATLGAWTLGPRAWAQPAATATPQVGQAGKDVIWLPTNQALVDRMLDMAGLTAQDRLVDLGSGDGRTVITAAKRGAIARGIEYNGDLVAVAKKAASAEGVAQRATFEQADIFKSDFSNATVVTLFLLPNLNMRLRPTLLAMKPGTRIVSNSFNMEDWEPDETARVDNSCDSFCTAYKWVVPAQVAGTWRLGERQLVLQQTFQMLSGELREGGNALAISDARMDGTRIRFSAGNRRYSGEVSGSSMRGTVDGGGSWTATRAAG